MRKNIVWALICMVIAMGLFACGGSGGNSGDTGSLRVRVVTNSNNIRVPNATVVLGNSNGSMISYGATDAAGEYTFSNPPANATVTAAFSCVHSGGTTTTYALSVLYDVNIFAVTIETKECESLSAPLSAPLGLLHINVTNSFVAATQWQIHIGSGDLSTSNLASLQTYTVYPSDLQSDGKLSIAVIARNGSQRIGYGTLLDQTFTNGMTVNINVNQSFSFVQYNLSNIPTTLKSVNDQITMGRKNTFFYFLDWGLSSTSTSTTLNVPYIPGFSDTFGYYVWVDLDQNNNGISESSLFLGNYDGTESLPTNQNFDFSQMPAIPANIVVSSATGTATPTITWSGMDMNANIVFVYFSVTSVGNSWIDINIKASPMRTSLVFPELPSALALFRPASIQSAVSVNNWVQALFTGYDDYLTKLDQWSTGSWSPPATGGTVKESSGSYSSALTLAPKLNKTSRTQERMRGL